MKKVIFFSCLAIVIFTLAILAVLYHYRCDDTKSLIVPTITKVGNGEKVVALTFDDGPSQEKTPALLDLLREEDIQATFFVLGEKVEERPDLITRMKDEGHFIANHSYSHKRLIFKLPWIVNEEIEKTDDALEELGVPSSKYFRPPYLDEMLILPLILKEKGKVIISYDVDPVSEFAEEFDANQVADDVISNVQPGSIVVLHDGIDRNTTEFIQVVQDIIVELRQEGYSFVTVDY